MLKFATAGGDEGGRNSYPAAPRRRGRASSTRGAGEEVNSPAGGARGDGGDVEGGVSIFKRLFEEGNWSLFLGGDFVQCDDIPLMMAGGKIQARK